MEGPYTGSIFKAEPLLKVSFRQGELYVPSLSFEIIKLERLTWHLSLPVCISTEDKGPCNYFLLWRPAMLTYVASLQLPCLHLTNGHPVGIWKQLLFSCLWNPEQDIWLSLLAKVDDAVGLPRLVGSKWILGKQWVLWKACIPLEFLCWQCAVLRFCKVGEWRMNNSVGYKSRVPKGLLHKLINQY